MLRKTKYRKTVKKQIIIALLLCIVNTSIAQSTKITATDFSVLIGGWKGSLTYLDYQSGKPYTMPADVDIEQIGSSNQFVFSNKYPDEPKANALDTVIISKKGDKIDDGIVKSNKKLGNGNIEIVTQRMGRDGNDNKKAIIRLTYTLGATTFTKRKDVQFVGTKKWIKRSEYSYTKNLSQIKL